MSESVSDDATIGRDHIEQRQRQADDCRAARCEHLAGLLDRLGLKRIDLNPWSIVVLRANLQMTRSQTY
jgi:hypothetical protein